jgi:hypothetical protein
MNLTRPHLRGRLMCAVAAFASVAMLAGGVLASPAAAAGSFSTHVSPTNTFALLLDVSGGSTSAGAPVIDWWADGGANQNWTFEPVGGNNTYEIINQNSSQCLTTDGVAGDQVFQLPCSGGATQLWNTQINPSNGAFAGSSIKSVYSGLYLDVNSDSPWPGASIDTWYWNGGSNQYFAAL